MDTLMKADIFFFVTTIAVVLISSLFAVAIIYIVRILRDLRYVTGVVRKQADNIASDIDDIRHKVKDDGLVSGIFNVITRIFMGNGKRSSDRKRTVKNEKK